MSQFIKHILVKKILNYFGLAFKQNCLTELLLLKNQLTE